MAQTERLNRFLSRSGIGSRRRADEIIAAGRVCVNGVPIEKLATQVDPDTDTVTVDGHRVQPQSGAAVWIVLNKARGTLTTRRDARGRETIFDRLPSEFAQLIPVGRLDYDTEGVILLTSDGDAANHLMHPRYQTERVYEAVVQGVPPARDLARLRQGIDLGDPTPARAEAALSRSTKEGSVIRLILREGRKREVKRMMEAIGYPVIRLRRASFAGINARGLEPGQWRRLTEAEISRISRESA
jgi:pseudouridine synthase